MAHNVQAELHAARFEDLGLTAYGATPDEAVAALKRMFNTFIHAHRRLGSLEDTLNQLGVNWYWADEYPSNCPPYENTNDDREERVRRALGDSGAPSWERTGIAANNQMAAAA